MSTFNYTEQGLKFAFDVRTTLNVSHVIFHPSTTSHSYDLYATSADKGDVLFLNLEAGSIPFLVGRPVIFIINILGNKLQARWILSRE